MKVVVIGAFPQSLINFRGDLINALKKAGHEVHAMSSDEVSDVSSELERRGVRFRQYPVERTGMNPRSELRTLMSLRKAFRQIQPELILAYTIKPVVWGGFAARTLKGVRFYALITGVGFALEGETASRRLLAWFVRKLYRSALLSAEKVIFQNPDNLKQFVNSGIVLAEKCEVVNGSGIDLVKFSKKPFEQRDNAVFLMIARLLKEKGVAEYVAAAKLVKERYPSAIFRLVGPLDSSPDGISGDQLERWKNSGVIEYLSEHTDVRPALSSCDVYVLPSYHEGTPRTVLEAMATGRPILTTNVPGCKETVVSGQNGWLVEKKNSTALAERMMWFIEHRDQLYQMGERSRRIAVEKYDVNKVNNHLMAIMGLV